jgi:hypothetical protein
MRLESFKYPIFPNINLIRMKDDTKVKFACGSEGHPDYCPAECQFGRFCKFLKTQSVKPRGMGESAKIVTVPAAKKEDFKEPKKDLPVLQPYYGKR